MGKAGKEQGKVENSKDWDPGRKVTQETNHCLGSDSQAGLEKKHREGRALFGHLGASRCPMDQLPSLHTWPTQRAHVK